MALNVCKLFKSDWGIGTTGYPATMPETGLTELFAYYAIVHCGEVVKSGILRSEEKEKAEVQQFYAGFSSN